MNLDLTKYLGEYGAAIAAAGVLIIGYLNNRTSNNLDTKISNMESMLLKVEHDLDTAREDIKVVQCEFNEYRRTHP